MYEGSGVAAERHRCIHSKSCIHELSHRTTCVHGLGQPGDSQLRICFSSCELEVLRAFSCQPFQSPPQVTAKTWDRAKERHGNSMSITPRMTPLTMPFHNWYGQPKPKQAVLHHPSCMCCVLAQWPLPAKLLCQVVARGFVIVLPWFEYYD